MTQDLIFKVLGDKRLRIAALLLVLAGLAQQSALIIWHLLPGGETTDNNQQTQVVRPSASNNSGENLQQQAKLIGRSFLFGKPPVAAAVKVAVVEEAPQTQLKYKLRGLYYSVEPRLAMAIVEVQPNKSKHYGIGDELASNIHLASIEADHILIDRYGKLERLNLEKPVPPTKQEVQRAQRGGSANSLAILRSYKQRYSRNPMALATRFQAIPVQQDGRNIGFKLKALRGESLLRKLNFEPDDVFLAVNGVELNNPFEALDALKSLTTAENISVTFMRDGAEQTLDFRI